VSDQLVRFADWPERLVEFIESRRHARFEWGVNDCCLFPADAVLAMTGTDRAADLRGHADEFSAMRVVRDAGGLPSLLASRLKERTVIWLAQRGDVVCATLDGRETAGIVAGNGDWCTPGVERLVFRPMSEVTRVFEV